MADPGDKFLSDGIARYSEACDTIDLFKTQTCQLIENVFAEELPALGFTVSQDKNAVYSKAAGCDGRKKQYWICGFATGKWVPTEGSVSIEVGIWWNSDETSAPVIYYAQFNEPERLRAISLRSISNTCKYIEGRGKKRIYEEPGPEQDIYDGFRRILKQLLNIKPPEKL